MSPASLRRAGWVVARLLTGNDEGGVAETLPPAHRLLCHHLASVPPEGRLAAYQTALPIIDNGGELEKLVIQTDPNGPMPEGEASVGTATLADVRRVVGSTTWPWPGWLASGALNGLASDPGVGKTILTTDLIRRLWYGLAWPDGRINPFPPETPALVVPGDHHFAQILKLADAYGLPDEAIYFNSAPDDPTGGLDLDDPETIDALDRRIGTVRPGLVVVDTVGATTGRNLCRAEEAREYFTPLLGTATRRDVPFLMLTHLNASGEALGRRINGLCRVVWKLTAPDPEGQPDRRRLVVAKSYDLKPPPLGVTITPSGCEFDDNPPEASQGGWRPGPAPAKQDECQSWLADRLADGHRKVVDLIDEAKQAGFSTGTLYRARDALGVIETPDKPKLWKL